MATDITNSSISITLSYEDTDALLHLLDEENARNAAIVFVYMALLMASGLPGNILVIVVYATKFKPTTTRSFIIALAAIDLVNCFLGMPKEVVDLYRGYTYPSLALCKIDALITSFSSLCSGNVLVALAADRYRRVCRPLSTQLTPGGASVAIVGCCLLALMLAWPFPLLYGFHKQTTRIPGVVGTGCDIDDVYTDTVYTLVFDLILCVVFVTCVATLTTLYALVFKQIRTRFRMRTSRPKATQLVTSASGSWATPMESCDSAEDETQTSIGCHDGSPETVHSTDVEANCTEEMDSTQHMGDIKKHRDVETIATRSTDKRLPGEGDSTEGRSSTVGGRQKPSKGPTAAEVRAIRNTTLTLFLVTLVYILSFLPYLIIMGLRAVMPEIFQGMSAFALAVYELLVRLTYVQSAVNPFIYALLNSEFRRKCREVLRCRKRG